MYADHMEYRELFDAAFADKQNWYAQYSWIYLYQIPNRTAFNVAYSYNNSARFENYNIYDYTPVRAAYTHANDLHGLLIPHDRIWGKFIVNDIVSKKKFSYEEKVILDKANAAAFDYINASNLASEASNAMLDLVGGTAVMKIESPSDREPLKFTCIPAYTVYLAPFQTEEVHNLWYKTNMLGCQVLDAFPKYKGKYASYFERNASDMVSIVTGQVRIDDKSGEYYHYCFLDGDYEHLLYESGSHYKLVQTTRSRVHPGESEGRGVAMDLIWIARDLNIMVREDRMSQSYKANPPLFYDSRFAFNEYSLRQGMSGAFIPMLPGGGEPIKAFQMPDNPGTFERIQDLRQMIEKAYLVEPLGEVEGAVKSATEVSIRENRAQRTSSTNISRLIKDFSESIYSTSIKLLAEKNLLPHDIHKFIQDKTLKFDFKSPLYDLQAQQNLTNLAQMFQIIQQFGGQGAVLAAADFETALPYIQENTNNPSNLLKSPEIIQQILQSMAQAQAAQNAPQVTPKAAAQQLPTLQAQGNAA